MTTLAASVREDLLPAAGRHPSAEAVSAEAAKVVGLESTLHGWSGRSGAPGKKPLGGGRGYKHLEDGGARAI